MSGGVNNHLATALCTPAPRTKLRKRAPDVHEVEHREGRPQPGEPPARDRAANVARGSRVSAAHVVKILGGQDML